MIGRWAATSAVGVTVVIVALVVLFGLARGERVSSVPVVVASGVDAVAVERLVEVGSRMLDGAVDPNGLAMTGDGLHLFMTDAAAPGVVLDYSGSAEGEPIRLESSGPPPTAIAVDPTTRDLVVALDAPAALEWREIESEAVVTRQDDAGLASAFVNGVAFDRNRSLIYGLRRGVISSFRYDPESNEIGSMRQQIDVTSLSSGSTVGGLSVDPVTGSLYLGNLAESAIYEIDQAGELVRILDLGRAGLRPTAFTIAASSDPSDQSGSTSVFVVDADRDSSSGAVVVELGAGTADAVGPDVVDRAELVQTISMAGIPFPAPDSSAIAWLPAEERLLVADSEVDEYDFFAGVNTWTVELDGVIAPVEITGGLPSTEPTGMAVHDNIVFITDDVAQQIHLIDLGQDGVVGADDTVRAQVDTTAFGCADPEDVAYDVLRNRLYVVDGGASEVFIIEPGPNGRFEGTGDDVISQFDVAHVGLGDPEGIAHDPDRDTILVVDRNDFVAVEFGSDGGVLRRIDLSAAEAIHLAGATWAPGSKGGLSLWTVDRGLDGPLTVDGRIYELAVPPLGDGMPEPSVVVRRSLVAQRADRNQAVRLTVEVENRGSGPLRLTDVRVHGADEGAITVVNESVPVEIPAASRSEILLEVAPRAEVPPGSRLVIESSDPNRPRTIVKLVVEG